MRSPDTACAASSSSEAQRNMVTVCLELGFRIEGMGLRTLRIGTALGQRASQLVSRISESQS